MEQGSQQVTWHLSVTTISFMSLRLYVPMRDGIESGHLACKPHDRDGSERERLLPWEAVSSSEATQSLTLRGIGLGYSIG